jgi:hypothetical protein
MDHRCKGVYRLHGLFMSYQGAASMWPRWLIISLTTSLSQVRDCQSFMKTLANVHLVRATGGKTPKDSTRSESPFGFNGGDAPGDVMRARHRQGQLKKQVRAYF